MIELISWSVDESIRYRWKETERVWDEKREMPLARQESKEAKHKSCEIMRGPDQSLWFEIFAMLFQKFQGCVSVSMPRHSRFCSRRVSLFAWATNGWNWTDSVAYDISGMYPQISRRWQNYLAKARHELFGDVMNLLLNLFCIPQMAWGSNLVQLHGYARPEVEICCEWSIAKIYGASAGELWIPTDTYGHVQTA